MENQISNHACSYAFFRFTPHIDTEEFVNVGIVVIDSVNKHFDYFIAANVERVVSFFPSVKSEFFYDSTKSLAEELERFKQLLNGTVFTTNPNLANNIFLEIISPKESLFKASTARALLVKSDESPIDKLKNLYYHRMVGQQ